MCASSSVKARAQRFSSTTDVGDLQLVIDMFLTRLQPYRLELEDEAQDTEDATDSADLVFEEDKNVVLLKVRRLASNSSQADQLRNPDLAPSRSASATSASSSSTTSEVR